MNNKYIKLLIETEKFERPTKHTAFKITDIKYEINDYIGIPLNQLHPYTHQTGNKNNIPIYYNKEKKFEIPLLSSVDRIELLCSPIDEYDNVIDILDNGIFGIYFIEPFFKINSEYSKLGVYTKKELKKLNKLLNKMYEKNVNNDNIILINN